MKLFNKLKFITVTTLIFHLEVYLRIKTYSQYYQIIFNTYIIQQIINFVYQGYPVTVIDSQITPLTA